MKRKMKYSLAGILTSALIAGTSFSAAAATVQVYADATYTDTNLVVNIVADIDASDGDPLVSGGVKLSYNTAELINPTAEKNQNVWYFGDGTINHAYVDPDTSVAGEIVFLLGRIDSTETIQSGVSGQGVLLGTVTLERSPAGGTVTDPATTFGVGVDLGKDRVTHVNYVNFASLAGVDLDSSVSFLATNYSTPCVLVGDINDDGIVNLSDFNLLKANWLVSGSGIPGDLNGDGIVNLSDFNLLKANWLATCP